ncbi:hypothetical protein LSH36_26g10042 [Paralvinella palmiformis]|uniref:NADPH:adrenodoxin oxidoreductase, mitochondrial n=1 Tax=Paralvinella palmiformis TaxID=53620 RepID=A0AAD9NER9_9ANNE|nr:hypothetical protein LSH36_26g10042 [Paralvinella palmiformis]
MAGYQKSLCSSLRRLWPRNYSTTIRQPHIAIVGSGPAGFYTAQQILKLHPTAEVDVYEKLPVPFGLVRFGVAPDHPEVKNVISTFTKTALNERFHFLGNVSVGSDLDVEELKKAYTAVVLDLDGVLSARSFVGWYNGLPNKADLKPNLDTDVAVVLGQGNVAIDVARILLTPVDILRKTDITQYALEALSKSRIKRVCLIGRRGPLQVAFTTAELREMTRLEGCRPVLDKNDFLGLEDLAKMVPQRRRRLTQLLLNTALEKPSQKDAARWQASSKEWMLKFLRSPKEILPDEQSNKVRGINFTINKLVVLRSVGYKSVGLKGIEFDSRKSVIPSNTGQVKNQPGVYCSGWVKRGPVGVIASTMTDAFETGKQIVDDLASGVLTVSPDHTGRHRIVPYLKNKDIETVSFEEWNKINEHEISVGNELNKPREKLTDIAKMLQIAKQ